MLWRLQSKPAFAEGNLGLHVPVRCTQTTKTDEQVKLGEWMCS